MQSKIRIGTRGSPLALYQAGEVRLRLMAAHGLDERAFDTVVIKTSGDLRQDVALAEIGGKELFTKEIEEQLLDGRIDLAVHSAKDMPTELPPGLTIGCVLAREDVRDAFISLSAPSFDALPPGAVIGTASLRRAAQVRRLRGDLQVVTFRGNVETRLRKLAEGVADATFLALAGLKRLGLADRAREVIAPERMLPAIGQGAICVETRANDAAVAGLLAAIDDAPTAACLAAERAFLAALDGSCRTPIAGLASLAGGRLSFTGEVLRVDGSQAERIAAQGSQGEAAHIGRAAGLNLKRRLPADFFALPDAG